MSFTINTFLFELRRKISTTIQAQDLESALEKVLQMSEEELLTGIGADQKPANN